MGRTTRRGGGCAHTFAGLIIAGGVLVLAPGAAAQSQTDSGIPSITAVTQQSPLARFAKPITLTLEEDRLEDVIAFLAQATGVTFDAVWRDDTHDAGLDPDALVTLHAEALPALGVLERALEQTGDAFDESTWQLTRAGAVQIGPRSILNRSRRIEIYDINDLLFDVPDFDEDVEIDLEAVLQQGEGQAGSILEDAGEPGQDEPAPAKHDRAEEIMDLITTLIETDQWARNGGDGASVRHWRGTLIVNAPEYIHRQIEAPF